DLGSPDETEISKSFDRPVMIHRYPAAVKAFYMKQDPQSPKHALCVDVIAPEGVGEIIGGGERADDLSFLEHKIEEEKLPKKFFEWYLDLRRYGSVPHAGFGLGLERTSRRRAPSRPPTAWTPLSSRRRSRGPTSSAASASARSRRRASPRRAPERGPARAFAGPRPS